MSDALTNATRDAFEGVVRAVAQQLGVPLDAAQVATIAAEGLQQLAGVVSSRAWAEARAAGDAAASRIATLEQAEESARKAK